MIPSDHALTNMRKFLLSKLKEAVQEYNVQSENRMGYCVAFDVLFISCIDLDGNMYVKAANLSEACITHWYNAFISEDKDILESFPDSMGNWEE